MGWFSNDYDRDYDRSAGYGRRPGGESAWGWGAGERHRGDPSADRGRWGTTPRRQGYGGDYASGSGGYSTWRQPDTAYGSNRYGYDHEHRARPEESPTYGRGGDQAVQRWARRYGYDMGYQIDPQSGRGGTTRGYEGGRQGYSSGGQGYSSGGQGYSSGGQGYSSGGQGYSSGGKGYSSRGQRESFGGRGESYGGQGFSRRNQYGRDFRW